MAPPASASSVAPAVSLRALVRGVLVEAHHRHVHLPRVQRVARALARQVGQARSLLDVGCGDGTVAQAIGAAVGASRIAGTDVKIRAQVAIEAVPYDGLTLPFADGEFEAVLISDVLHHCVDPDAVLREALRVASRVVAIKDHFRFGAVTGKILLWMDLIGNSGPAVEVRGTYFDPAEWARLVAQAGGRITGLEWPLQIHDYPFRLVTQDRLQFAASVQRVTPGERS